MIQASCKNCEERYIGCHDKCERYIKFRAQRTEDNEKKKKYAESMGRNKIHVHRVNVRVENSPLRSHKK